MRFGQNAERWSGKSYYQTTSPGTCTVRPYTHEKTSLTTPHSFPPKRAVDDVELLKGDAVVLWLFSLVQKTASSAAAPNFPGWLAPVTLDPISFTNFLAETIWVIGAWCTTSAAIGAYELKTTGKQSEEGEMYNAVNGAVLNWIAFVAPAYFGINSIRGIVQANASGHLVSDNISIDLGLINPQAIPHGFPITSSLCTVLLTMVSWRGYIKVIGLMGWWREGRVVSDAETSQLNYLKNAQIVSVSLAVVASVVDFLSTNSISLGEW